MDSKLIIGVFVVLIGVSIIVNHVFKIDLPLFRIAFAAFIIYIGIKILTGSFGNKRKDWKNKDNAFSSSTVTPESVNKDEEFNAIFGSSVIDLRTAQFTNQETDIEVNAIFGEAKVYLPAQARVKIKSSSVFGSVKTPDGRETSFGDDKTILGNENAPTRINLEANAVFGSVKVYSM